MMPDDASAHLRKSGLAGASDPEPSNRQVAKSLSKHNLTSHSKTHWVLESQWFKAPITVGVIANIIQLGLSVDIRGGAWDEVWKTAEYVFAFLFGSEMLIKVSLLKLEYFKDPWNVVDFMLAWLAISDAITTAAGTASGAANKVTMLRILRLTRILRTVRLFKIFKELVIIVEVMLKSLKTLFWLLLLVTLLVYMHAIICVELIGSDKSYPAYSEEDASLAAPLEDFNNFQFFGTIFRSMFSLFNLITLSEWSTITRPISEAQPILVFVMVSFTMLTSYGIMNVLIGIMVEHALTANLNFAKAKEMEYKEEQMELVNTVATIITENDNDGLVTEEELETILEQDGKLASILTKIDLPEACTIEELFVLIDENGDGHVTRSELVSCMHRMLYCSEFQRLCLMQISLNNLKRLVREVAAEVRSLQKQNIEGDAINNRNNGAQVGKSAAHESKNTTSEDADASFKGPDQLHMLQAELREMRLEIGMRFASLQAACLQSKELCLTQPSLRSRGSRDDSEPPPPPKRLPPAFSLDVKDNSKCSCCPETTHQATCLPGRTPTYGHREDAKTNALAPQPQGFALQADVLAIISMLEATVGELQKHSELEFSIRKNDLECQHAMRKRCFELASCLAEKLTGHDNPSTSFARPQKRGEFSL